MWFNGHAHILYVYAPPQKKNFLKMMPSAENMMLHGIWLAGVFDKPSHIASKLKVSARDFIIKKVDVGASLCPHRTKNVLEPQVTYLNCFLIGYFLSPSGFVFYPLGWDFYPFGYQ